MTVSSPNPGAPPAPGGASSPVTRRKPWILFALEDALLDTRAGRVAVIHLLSGATEADVARFEATGEFDEPWILARAIGPWVRAGRPLPLPTGGWRVVVNHCGGDPGDLVRRADALWDLRGWKAEAPRVDAARLHALAEVAHLGVVTRRDRGGLARAEEVLGYHFEAATTFDEGLRPDADVLTRHATTGHFIGVTAEDRATAEEARFVFHDASRGLAALVDRMIKKLAPIEPLSPEAVAIAAEAAAENAAIDARAAAGRPGARRAAAGP